MIIFFLHHYLQAFIFLTEYIKFYMCLACLGSFGYLKLSSLTLLACSHQLEESTEKSPHESSVINLWLAVNVNVAKFVHMETMNMMGITKKF